MVADDHNINEEVEMNRLVSDNMGLVYAVARKYSNSTVTSLSMEDLIQEGNLGLIKAAQKYDPEFGTKFSTYATLCIEEAIKRALESKSDIISKPIHMMELIARIKRTSKIMLLELEREPKASEISERLGVAEEKVKEALEYIKQTPISLDTEVSEDSKERIADTIADSSSNAPSVALERKMLREDMMRLLKKELNEKQYEVVVGRFGLLADGEEKTLEEIGKELNVTKQRASQIEKEALAKLKTSKALKLLQVYFEAE